MVDAMVVSEEAMFEEKITDEEVAEIRADMLEEFSSDELLKKQFAELRIATEMVLEEKAREYFGS